MKQNSLKTIPKIFVIIMLCIMFSDCKDKTHDKTNDADSSAAEFTSTSEEDYFENEKVIKRSMEPIPPNLRSDMLVNFTNNYGINTGLNIDTVPLAVNFNSIKIATNFIITDTIQDTLIAKYFVLVTPTTPGENKYFSYVVAAAQKTTSPISGNDTISPIPHPSGGFLLVAKNNSNGKLITSAEFRTMLNDYTNSIRFVNGG